MGLLDRAKELKDQKNTTSKIDRKGLLKKALSKRPPSSDQETDDNQNQKKKS